MLDSLRGVSILEVGAMAPGKYCGFLLVGWGARSMRIERTGGDGGISNEDLQLNRGKQSKVLNLRDPSDRGTLLDLAREADVLIECYRPGVTARLGIDYDTCRELNPRLIYHYAGAYGSTGPSAHRPAFHPIPGAVCGGALYQAGRGTPPPPEASLTPEQIRQISSSLFRANEGNPDVSSALAVATALTMALYARVRTNAGQYLETTMICSNLYANSDAALDYDGKPRRLLPDQQLNGLHALYRFYAANTGWIFLACVTEKEWQRLLSVGELNIAEDDPLFVDAASRRRNDAELATLLQRGFEARPAEQWEKMLSERGVPCAVARETGAEDFANTEESMKQSGLWTSVAHGSLDTYWRYGPGVQLSDAEARLGATSDAGEHTVPILLELGYDTASIEELRLSKIIGSPGGLK